MVKFKVVITDFGSPENDLEKEVLDNSGLDIELVRLNASTAEELIPHVKDAHALIVQWAKITPEIIAALENCIIISRYGIGVDMVDLTAAGEHGVMVCNVPEFCIEEVSTHTITCILMLNRRIIAQHERVRAGLWGAPPGNTPARPSTQTVGVVGLGNIGREVARKIQAMGLKVIAFDPYLDTAQAAALGVEKVDLEILLRQADYVCLHCPLTEETHHLIGAEQLALMKPSAYLINMARGPVVDQPALYEALAANKIAGAALDVFEQEPIAADDPLLKLDNVIFSPHLSSWSTEAVVQLRRDAAHNVVVALKGERPSSVVNRKALKW